MKFYINDFSYQSGTVLVNHRNLIENFVDVCERALSFKYEQLYMPDDFKIREIVTGLTFVSFIDAAHPTDNLRVRLRSVLANQTKKINSDSPDDSVQFVYWNNIDSDFLKKAHNRDTPVASFRTGLQFDIDSLPIRSEILYEDGSRTSTNASIFNLSNSNHFQVHAAFLNAKAIEQANTDKKWNSLTQPLRFTDRISQFLSDIKYFEKLNGDGDANYKRGLFFDTGTEIAEINGWVHDTRVSRINSTPHKKRKVFVARNPTAYLSIDFMHGAFELHDRHGVHIGEYNFNGVDLNSTYNDNSHNITV